MTAAAAAGAVRMAHQVWRHGWRPALMVLGLVAAGLLLHRFGLNDMAAAAAEQGVLAFVTLGALACAVGVPRQVTAYAAGLVYGVWPGAAIALVAEGLGCAVDFYWAPVIARRQVSAWLARGGRVARIERFLVANTFGATLTLRLLPVGSNIGLNLVAGVSGVRGVTFIAASVLGYVPQSVIFALLGAGVRVSGSAQIGLAVALLVVSVGIGFGLLRRGRGWRG